MPISLWERAQDAGVHSGARAAWRDGWRMTDGERALTDEEALFGVAAATGAIPHGAVAVARPAEVLLSDIHHTIARLDHALPNVGPACPSIRLEDGRRKQAWCSRQRIGPPHHARVGASA